MSEPDDGFATEELREWLLRLERRGTGEIDARSNRDKAWLEEFVALQFAVALKRLDGREMTDIRSNPNDPPDILCMIDGRQSGVECVEFVDGAFIADVDRTRREGRTLNAYGGSGFARTQWTEARFRQHLDGLLQRKSEAYLRRGLEIEILLIYTAETWLGPVRTDAWLPHYRVDRPTPFGEILFLQNYRPPDGYPLYRLSQSD